MVNLLHDTYESNLARKYMGPNDVIVKYKRSNNKVTMIIREENTKKMRAIVTKDNKIVIDKILKEVSNKKQLRKTKQQINEQNTVSISNIEFIPVLITDELSKGIKGANLWPG